MEIKKILIANRGEIAIRIMKTCQERGIESHVLYACGEENLPHVLEADYSHYLGEGILSETYLNIDKIIKIALDFKIDAIHPGYGLLSENSNFAKKVQENKIIFIGPTPEAIELMGDKCASKIKMEELKVPMVPGYHGDDQSIQTLLNEAEKIGLPVMIKASAGGGGKGMRAVFELREFESAVEMVKRESFKSFGSDHLIIEKLIERPRHIEVQVLSDSHGHHLHLFERECSIQRRHQKIIEESPSIFLSEKKRLEMCEASIQITKGINYLGVGTIEYIVDQEENFYFLEMNTRLQVEHPVTEMVTGIDLVGKQIDVAEGRSLNFIQKNIFQRGHAIEARIYAEDPDNNFLPTIGTIFQVGKIKDLNVRFDTGYVDNNSVGIDYDPMLAKLIVWGEDRNQCIRKMILALMRLQYFGVKTNREYLIRILRNNHFQKGEISTHFVVDFEGELEKKELSEEEEGLFYQLYFELKNNASLSKTFDQVGPWEMNSNFRTL